MRIIFLHPDLGLGGAERLVVDAAMSLAARGHDVTVATSHWNPARAFAEARGGAFSVVCAGDWLPRSFLGRGHVAAAWLRAAYLTLAVVLAGWLGACQRRRAPRPQPRGAQPAWPRWGAPADVYIADQVAAYVPLLRALTRARVVFYVHFPDARLAPAPAPGCAGAARRAYRAPFDALEAAATGCAQQLLVNSRFTRGVARAALGAAVARARLPVLYPCIDVPRALPPPPPAGAGAPVLFLSINRFERKKALALALDAFAAALRALPPPLARRAHLVLAGGYDVRLAENVEHYAELAARAVEAGLSLPAGLAGLPQPPPGAPPQRESAGQLTLLRSISDEQKRFLLAAATAVLYTPSNEHFGIVPIETAAAARPVIAVASGGPLESVRHGETGLLCKPTTEAFAAAIASLAVDLPRAARMGSAGHAHVLRTFSRDEFGARLERACLGTLDVDDGAPGADDDAPAPPPDDAAAAGAAAAAAGAAAPAPRLRRRSGVSR